MICPTVQHTRMTNWIHRHRPLDGSVTIRDVTSMYTVLNIIGPKSREMIHELTTADMRMTPFTYKVWSSILIAFFIHYYFLLSIQECNFSVTSLCSELLLRPSFFISFRLSC